MIVFKSYSLYTPLRSKIKSAVRIPLGLGRYDKFLELPNSWSKKFIAHQNNDHAVMAAKDEEGWE
jgi:hypothetical protein